MPVLTAPISRNIQSASDDDSLRLAQLILRALRSTDVASWCAVDLTMPQLKTLLLADSAAGSSHGEIAHAPDGGSLQS